MRMYPASKLFAGLILLFGSGVVEAQFDRGLFQEKRVEPPLNILKEGESVMVLNETSVQEKAYRTRRVYSLLGGQMQADHLTLVNREKSVTYDLTQPVPLLAAEVGYYPFMWNGLWGVRGGVWYGTLNQNQRVVHTVLHLVPGELLVMYRGELRRRSWVKPFIGLGGTVITALQRGSSSDYNTSEARGMGLGVLGFGFNLNRVFGSDTLLDWELTGQYKRTFGSKKDTSDLTGSAWNAGITLAL